MSGRPTWLLERRESAAQRLEGVALPGPKDKGWEFTDLTGLDLGSYRAPAAVAPAESIDVPDQDDRVAVPGTPAPLANALRLVQSGESIAVPGGEVTGNGRPDGPVVMSLEAASARFPDLLAKQLGTIVTSDDAFVSFNDATWAGGAFVYIPAGVRLEQPVDLSALQPKSGGATIWRALIVLEDGAEAEVWETYRSAHRGDALFNGITEIRVGAGANLRFVCAQGLSEESWAFATQRAEIERDGSLHWFALGFGSARGKVRMETKLAGPGSNARVTGVYAGCGTQHLDYDTTQEHAAEHTTSDLAFRGVLADRSTAVWRGMIRVDEGAQQTDAFQESRNLLISPDAHADAIPGLEIEADDVRCTHAAAVAQVDPEQVYYLTSRGLPLETAKGLVVEGFVAEVVERAGEGPSSDALRDALDRRLATLLR